jgi:molybdopterin synthase sulfur carrier subunit
MTNEADMRPITLLYFARLSDQLGTRQESLPIPEGVESLGQLRAYLSQRGGQWQALDDSAVRMAVNQEIAGADSSVRPGDEIAFFPPVTGG